jgi:hypothetical protein
VKRLARIGLEGRDVVNGPLPADAKIEVMRKIRLKIPPKPAT